MADNRSYVYGRLRRELGLTPAQAAGAVGGLGGESGRTLDPNAVNPSSGALGIGQWLGGRARGVRKGDLRSQTNHLIAELKGPERSALSRLRGAHNISDATRAWVEGFERPSAAEIASSMPARLGYARDAFNAFHRLSGGGSAGGGGGAQQPGRTVSSGSSGPQSTAPDFGDAQTLLPLLKAMQGQPQPRASAPLPAPAFSAQAALPGGYQTPVSGGGPAPKPDMNALLSAVQTVGGAVPQSQVQTVGGRQLSVQSGGGGSVGRATAAGRRAAAGGKVKITGPNPGRIRPEVRNFMGEISAVRGGRPVVGSDGTGHSYRTVNGAVSEHSTGQASDIPAAGRELVNLGQAALIAAGMPRAQARRQTGGLFNVNRGGRRYQIIFATSQGGNHFDHLHVGVSRRK